METINDKEFLQKIENNKKTILIFGKVGIEGLATVQEYMKEKKEVK